MNARDHYVYARDSRSETVAGGKSAASRAPGRGGLAARATRGRRQVLHAQQEQPGEPGRPRRREVARWCRHAARARCMAGRRLLRSRGWEGEGGEGVGLRTGVEGGLRSSPLNRPSTRPPLLGPLLGQALY